MLNARLLRYRSRPEGEDARVLAEDLLHAQRYGDARGVAVSALGEDGEDAGLLVLEGRAWLMERDLLRAQAALVRAVRADRECSEAYRWLGEVLLGRGDASRALRALERAVALNPDDAEATALLARVQAMESEREAAAAAEAMVASARQEVARVQEDVASALDEERITPVPVEVLEAIDEVIEPIREATRESELPVVMAQAEPVAEPAALVVEAPRESEMTAAVAQAEPVAEPAVAVEDPQTPETPEPLARPEAAPEPDVVHDSWQALAEMPLPPAPAAVWEPPLVASLVDPVEEPARVEPEPIVAIAAPRVALVEQVAPVAVVPIVVAAVPRVPPRPPPVPKVADLDLEPVTLPTLPPHAYDDHEPELHAPSLPPDALDDDELDSDPAGPNSSEPPAFAPPTGAAALPSSSDAIEGAPEAVPVASVSYAPAAWSRSVSPASARRVGVGATALLLCAGAFVGWTLRTRETAEHEIERSRLQVLAQRAEADARARAAVAERAAAAESAARVAREQAALAEAAAAEAARKAAAEAAEEGVPARLARIDQFLANGRVADAQAELTAIPEAERDASAVREAGARVALARGLAVEALALIEPLATARKPSATVLALYGHALYRLDRVNIAAAAFDRALARDASSPEALIGRAEVHLRAERPGDALALLDRAERALEQQPVSRDVRARMHTLAGRAYVERHGAGDRELAVAASRKALALGSAPAEAHFWLGEALGGRNTRPAADAFKKYLQREPTGRYVGRAKRALGPML